MRIIIILLFGFVTLFGQDSIVVSEQLNKLFEISKDKKYKKACDYIAYTGADVERKLTSSLNPQKAEELNEAERMVKKIKAYIDISDSHEIADSSSQTIDGKEHTTVVVAFKSGKQELKIPFKFIKHNGNYLLVSID